MKISLYLPTYSTSIKVQIGRSQKTIQSLGYLMGILGQNYILLKLFHVLKLLVKI